MNHMANGVSRPPAQKEPNGSKNSQSDFLGGVSPQTSLPFSKTFLEWVDIGYRALQAQSAESFDTQGHHADECGLMNGDFSLRIRHETNDKGQTQRAFMEMLMALAMKPGGLEGWCARVLKEKGYRIEPMKLPTPEETARALAAELNEKQKRRMEREQGWPEGWLDR